MARDPLCLPAHVAPRDRHGAAVVPATLARRAPRRMDAATALGGGVAALLGRPRARAHGPRHPGAVGAPIASCRTSASPSPPRRPSSGWVRRAGPFARASTASASRGLAPPIVAGRGGAARSSPRAVARLGGARCSWSWRARSSSRAACDPRPGAITSERSPSCASPARPRRSASEAGFRTPNGFRRSCCPR